MKPTIANMRWRRVRADLLDHLNLVTKAFLKREGLSVVVTVEDNTTGSGKGNWMVVAILRAGEGKAKHPAAHVTVIVYQHVTPYPLKTRKMPLFVDAYVNLVYTNERYRGRGYAAILLRMFTKWFDERSMVVNLDVASLGDVKEVHLVRFYKHVGFEMVEKNDDLLGGSIMVRKPSKLAVAKKGKVSSMAVMTKKAELDKLLGLAAKAGL